jgi:hypothetical protein
MRDIKEPVELFVYKSRGVFPGSTAYSNWRHNINLLIPHDCKLLGCQCAIICSPKKSSIEAILREGRVGIK